MITMASKRSHNWSSDKLLQYIVHSQNNVVHKTTGERPYTLLRLRYNVGYLKQLAVKNNLIFDHSMPEFVQNPQALHDSARKKLEAKAENMRLRSIQDCPEYVRFEPGDRVYVARRGSSNHAWQPAATVIKVVAEKDYLIQWITQGNRKKDYPGTLVTYRHEYAKILVTLNC